MDVSINWFKKPDGVSYYGFRLYCRVLDPRFVKPPSPVDLALELSKDDIACLLRQ